MTLAVRGFSHVRGVATLLDEEFLITATEFERLTTEWGCKVTAVVVGMWRTRGKIAAKGRRGRSPLFRLGDLMGVECQTRLVVEKRGGPDRTNNVAA